ncbi:hypothetical protein LTR17_018996 [Elasticomyces elasticus]|nr:hypothetical protein LTR17_018996 [Elasticomyces elasticus]
MAGNGIASQSDICMQLLDHLIAQDVSPSSDLQAWAQDQQMRFNLWVAKLGVFAGGHYAVAYRLRKNEVTSQAILQLLSALSDNLQACIEYLRITYKALPDYIAVTQDISADNVASDQETQTHVLAYHEEKDSDTAPAGPMELTSDEESGSVASSSDLSYMSDHLLKFNDSHRQNLQDCIVRNINDLLHFASLIRQYNVDRSRRRGEDYEPSTDNEDSDSDDDRPDSAQRKPIGAKFQSYINTVVQVELGPRRAAEQGLGWLKDRLQNSMMRRWRRLCYHHKRAKQLRKRDYALLAPPSAPTTFVPTTFVLLQTARSTGDLASEPKMGIAAPLNAAPSILSGATTFQSKATISGLHVPKSNTAKSASRPGVPHTSLPSLPNVVPLGSDNAFDCPYCDALPRVPRGQSQRDRSIWWKSHLLQDLIPYVCLDQHCTQADTDFTFFHEWLEHMHATHWQPVWICAQCQPGATILHSDQELRDHIINAHDLAMSAGEVSILSRFSCRDHILPECLICSREEGLAASQERDLPLTSPIRQRNLISCIANHLETLALSSIPWHLGRTDENMSKSNEAEGTDHAAESLDAIDSFNEMDGTETNDEPQHRVTSMLASSQTNTLQSLAVMTAITGAGTSSDMIATWQDQLGAALTSDGHLGNEPSLKTNQGISMNAEPTRITFSPRLVNNEQHIGGTPPLTSMRAAVVQLLSVRPASKETIQANLHIPATDLDIILQQVARRNGIGEWELDHRVHKGVDASNYDFIAREGRYVAANLALVDHALGISEVAEIRNLEDMRAIRPLNAIPGPGPLPVRGAARSQPRDWA